MAPDSTELPGNQRDDNAAATAAADLAAFEGGFDGSEPTETPAQAPAQASNGADKHVSPATPAARVEAPSTDAHADLPEWVRTQLARIPTLEHENSSNRTRVQALNAKVKTMEGDAASRAATPPPPPAAPLEELPELKHVRDQGLPEVADAIAAAMKRAVPTTAAPPPPVASPPPAPSPSEPSADEKQLNEKVPDWAQRFVSQPFQIWLTQQPAEYRTKIMTTDKAGDMLDAFDKFGGSGPGAPPPPAPPPPQGRDDRPEPNAGVRHRQARIDAGVLPRGTARAPLRTSNQLTDEDAFEAGFAGKATPGI